MPANQNPLLPARFSPSRPLKTPNFGTISSSPQLKQELQIVENSGSKPSGASLGLKKKKKTSQAVLGYLQRGNV